MKTITTSILAVLLCAATAIAVPGDRTRAALNQPLPEFNSEGGELREVVPAISRATGIPIILDGGVGGTVNFEVTGMTLRQFLTAACSTNGLHFVVHPDEYILIRSRVIRIYPIDYLAAEAKVQTTSSVGLSSSSSDSGGSGSTTTTTTAGGTSGGGGASGQNQISITNSNDALFWKELEDHGKAVLLKDEKLVFNRTSGIAYLDASLATHAAFEANWRRVMSRANRGVLVKVTVLNVELENSKQLGVDWNVAAFSTDGMLGHNLEVGRTFTDGAGTATSGINGVTSGITSVATNALQPSTFTGTIGLGKVSALVTALQTQGNVRKESSPTIALLNNRTSVIQMALERNFFSRSNDYEVVTGTTGSSSSTVNGTKYTATTRNFGVMLTVTDQVSDENVITLDLEPVLTDFQGTDSSTDGYQNLPRQNVQRMKTQVQLRSGESFVIGGLNRVTDGDQNRSVPYLSSIPLLGKAFQNNAKISQRSELVIIVTADLKEIPAPKPIEVYTPDPAQGIGGEVVASAYPIVLPVPAKEETSASTSVLLPLPQTK